MKCPKCGAECVENAKFCEECGYAFPQQKECPKCHTMLKPTAKFCLECGYNFVAGKSNASGGDSPKGMSIGDKNVIAGDVVGRKDAYNISGSATFVTNTDETKKLVQCHVCGRNILIGESRNCPVCHKVTCNDCIDIGENMCKKCIEERNQGAEERFTHFLEQCYEDGKISLVERQEMEQKQKLCGISDRRAFELEKMVKARFGIATAKSTAAQPTSHEKMICQRAFDLFYGEGKIGEAFALMEPLYRKYPTDEEVLDLYLSVLVKHNEIAAQNFVNSCAADVLVVYLAAADLLIAHGNWSGAEEKLATAEKLWQGNFQVACRRILCLIKMGKQMKIGGFIDEGVTKLLALPRPSNLVEKSWHFKVKAAYSEALGDDMAEVSSDYCKAHGLSPLLCASFNKSRD